MKVAKRGMLIMAVFLALSYTPVYAQSSDTAISEEVSVLVQQDLNEGRELYAEGKYEKALEKFNAVLEKDPENTEALEYKKMAEYKIDLQERFNEGVVSLSAAEREKVNSLFKQGKTLLDAGDLDGAMKKFQELIEINPLHIPARRYIDYILLRKREIAEKDKEIIESQRILDVKKAWLPPKKKKSSQEINKHQGQIESQAMARMKKKVNVIIDEINFTAANLRDVLNYLSKVSGVNILLDDKIFSEGGTIKIPKEISLKEGEKGVESTAGGYETISDRVTISLKKIPLIDALKYILKTKGLKYRIDEYAIFVSTPDVIANQEMETRFYHLRAGIGAFTEFKKSIEMGGGINTGESESDMLYDLTGEGSSGSSKSSGGDVKKKTETAVTTIKDVLEQSGVPFPPGSSVFLDKRTATLIIRNTPDNLALIEKILDIIDKPPFQIEIEAKFVSINQTALQEMGFEWLLKSPIKIDDGKYTIDNHNFDQSYGKYPSEDSLRGDQYDRGLTKGVRFFESGSQLGASSGLGSNSKIPTYYPSSDSHKALGNILSLSGVLTDPEFRMIMHALDQSGNANELSAPKVTTLNNQQAQLEAVTELRYPSGYDVTPPVVGNNSFAPGMVTPSDFVTRDVGIILTVTPSVGSDRRTITLTLIPEVSEFVGWVDYGFDYITQHFSLIQPIFKSRNVTTSVIINDGDTIVLGGLITEETQKIKDKVPILGDVPILGRLFRSEGERTSKTNLLIFVTARLLDPSGNALRD